ncbi:MAG: DUF1549 and DUF1553 domain-containing protein [Gemmataceae bacterium]
MVRCSLIAAFCLAMPSFAFAGEPTYRNEVMAVLSRGGCNLGTCHGNLNGKGGLKLSLRGENPDFDYRALTRDVGARRLLINDPDASLILLKAAGKVPHEGGVRFSVTSPEYRILQSWIARGAANDGDNGPKLVGLKATPGNAILPLSKGTMRVAAQAIFADGSKRDVSGLAVFESTNFKADVTRDGEVTVKEAGETTIIVRYLDQQTTARLAFVLDRPGFRWNEPAATNDIDRHIGDRLRALKMNPSELCTDSEFIRRLYLDVLGMLPRPEETQAFLADKAADKRAKLIDAVLARPEYADWWALKWSDVLRVEEKSLDAKGVKVFHAWIRKAMAENRPLNEFAREILSAQGSTYQVAPANYYQVPREPNLRAEATRAQVFLGVRMQCAKCHNHPFDRWTQDDYHHLAAFFARVKYRIVENNRRDKLDSHEFIGEQVVHQNDAAEVKHPVTGATLKPRALGETKASAKEKEDRLKRVADWVADGNPLFAKAQANRIWAHMMGKGLVDPIDDFRLTNPPTNEALLDTLAGDFVGHRYDMKHLIRSIANSRAYQRSSRPNETNADDEDHGSHALVRPMQAEALLDAIAQVAEVPNVFPDQPAGTRAVQIPSLPSLRRGAKAQEAVRFLRTFGKPERLLTCECERQQDTTLNQTLTLISGEVMNRAISAEKNRVGRLLEAKTSPNAMLDELFLAGLSRLPTDSERQVLASRLASAEDKRTAAEDILWGILNSKEFLLRR